jgi:S-DNA-T family DNA segregation ATPase FtsK/SpoIIIE
MIVTLMTTENYSTITLPERIGGQYLLPCNFGNGSVKDTVSIEGVSGKWRVKSNKRISIVVDPNSTAKTVELEQLGVYNLVATNTGNRACIYTEPISDDRQTFSKMMLKGDTAEIIIGRFAGNDLAFVNTFASSKHAKLTYDRGNFSIEDLGSTNGTFVNGQRVNNQTLLCGDMIWIMGFKIIVGQGFIAFNNPDGKVAVNARTLLPYLKQPVDPANGDEDEENETNIEYFYRSPRFKRDIEQVEFKIDSPPQNAIGDEMPLMMVIGPSMTMGMASLTMGIFAVNNAITNGNISAAVPSIAMSGSMLLGTVLWPILTKRYEKRRKRKKEALRQKKYREYLDKISVKFNDECSRQEEILRENHIDISECIKRIQGVQRNLWERGFRQNDFLKLRVGIGDSLLSAEITYAERKFSIEEDNLQEELYTLCETPKLLQDVPLTISLFDSFVSGIIGKHVKRTEFAKGLIFQIASLYSYDEIKMVFIYDEGEGGTYEFAKWLPHVWSDDRKFRFIATNNNEVKEVSAYLEKEIEVRKDINENDMEDITPYYIIFTMSKALAARADMLKQIFNKKANLHISVVSFCDELKDLPKECQTVVALEGNMSKIFDKNDISGQHISFCPDIFVETNTTALSVGLANVQLDTLANSFKLPSLIAFLEMFGVGKVEHLNALTRWKENDPTISLAASVGVDTLGDEFKIDLHEKFHGPHGLVAGMTGSGKSEFIIAYILSMAVNYHPNEVAFILIDYKGGGMAKAFENLPHTAGIITNLDGAAVKRSLISIESELKRRQAIFAEASKKIGVSNIDIYKYQKLYRDGTVSEPLQHLFIISDEFAELKTQQPDFMAQLISAARIGRSLGVHLILATQKPSGVVDDQIWSNSRFRICLKVQERADSMDMLKRQDAAELSDTGRFYLQVGYNELFELGQSAWAGAPYYPSERVIVEKDKSVTVINRNGQPIRQAKLNTRSTAMPNPKKQLDVITQYLCDIAETEKIKIRPLWMDPIPAFIRINDIKKKYSVAAEPYVLNPVMGEYDDPAGQRQCVLRLPISQEGNTIIYGIAGSGKTTFLTTMIYSLMQEHTPEEVNIYILDFASETLRAFAKAPHIGDVILSYEAEKISNLFKMLNAEMGRRKKLFTDYGGDYRSYIQSSAEQLPSIVVAINNFAVFTESYEEKEEAVSYLSREGTKYGIYFVLAATGTGAVRFRMLQNFKQLIVLQLNDESDYATIVGKTEGLLPSKCKGRGLIKTNALYEFQVAQITDDAVPFSFIRNTCDELHGKWNGSIAKKIPLLPEVVNAEFISEYVDVKKPFSIPIGVEKNSLEVHYYDFHASMVNLVLASGEDYMDFIAALTDMLQKEYSHNITVFDIPGSYISDFSEVTYCGNAAESEAVINELFDLTVQRNNTYKEAVQGGTKLENFEPRIVIINSLAALKSGISSESNEKLSLIMEKGEAKYGISVIIAEASKNLSSFTFEKWYKKHISLGDGVWIGGGIMDQYQIKASKSTPEMHDEMDSEFGFSLVKGKPVKIKVLTRRETEEL